MRIRLSPSSFALSAIVLLFALSRPTSAGVDLHSRHSCLGSLDVPIQIELSLQSGAIAPGSITNARATVTARAALSNVRAVITMEGVARLLGPSELSLGSLGRGEIRELSIPVIYGNTRSAMIVQIFAENAESGMHYDRNEGLYGIIRNGKVRAAMGDYVLAEMQAIRDDREAGLLTAVEADQQLRSAMAMPASFDQIPRPLVRPSTDQARFPTFTSMAAGQDFPRATSARSAAGTLTVQGTVSWLDENGASHPCYGMTVEVRDDDTIGSELVAVAATDVTGQYSFTVDNDDPGGRDIFVRFRTTNNAVSIEAMGGGVYQADSPIHGDQPDGAVITENFTAANTGTGPAAGLLTGASYVAVYAYMLNGNSFLSHLRLEWPGATGSANYNGSRINLRPGDRWDWDVMFHEYGHYIMDTFDFENNPGGPHNIGDCISDVHNSKDEGVRMGWGEGWPTYDGTVAQQVLNLASLNVPRVGDVSYTDTGESNFTYSLEVNSAPPSSGDNNGLGEDNEIAMQRVFWDVFDAGSDSRDNVSFSDQTLFNIVNAADPTTLSAAWTALRATLSNADQLAYGAITTDHQIGPSLVAPAANTIVGTGNANFSWNRNVGCSTTYDGDSFDLRFFNAATKAPILTIPGLSGTSASLTNAQLATLIASSHQVLWAVEGRNTSSPATGPYLGESFAITVNRPPVANAGPDQPSVECASHSTTAVQLDGSGSNDPDGDALQYTWSAAGISFDDNHAKKPIGQFPKGTTVVTLTVSDGIESDQDQVTIRVVDTTPPVIHCPSDIAVECTSHSGTPATDPAIAAFLAGASATDVCDATPTLSNNAPGTFPHGSTAVTFTATDDDLNQSQCQATVKVVDTTPPTIDVTLDRYVLWPPNHKLVTIAATVSVSDICDPTPTFVLTSITSNEPDNGLGDGDMPNDIQGTAYGTSDLEFQLRSERSGTGTGRVYTIVYTANDDDGNTASKTVYVRVPHSQKGTVVASNGMNSLGNGFAPGTEIFALVIPSQKGSSDEIEVIEDTPDGSVPSLLLDASHIVTNELYVGNTAGAFGPVKTDHQDVNGDGLMDLIAYFSIRSATALAQVSDAIDGPLGLHFTTLEAADYLASDIFSLGAPLALPAGGGDDPADVADTPTTLPVPEGERTVTPLRTGLVGIQPNPMHFGGNVVFTLALAQPVQLTVYNVQGRLVKTLVSGTRSAGSHQAQWDGRDGAGQRLPGGIYFVKLAAGRLVETRRAVLIP